MAESRHALTAAVVVEFCKLCNWAYDVWLNHRLLFDDNPRMAELEKSVAGEEFKRLAIISHEYSLLQIRKLHDGKITLGIDYVCTYGNWDTTDRTRLNDLAKKLDIFAKQLQKARNKTISHNDLATVKKNATLGDFAKGEDAEYFRNLQEFVNIVHKQVIGDTWDFDGSSIVSDVAGFLKTIKPEPSDAEINQALGLNRS